MLATTAPPQANPKRRLAEKVGDLINRVYLQGIDRLNSLDVNGNIITGLFSDDRKLFEFTLDLDRLESRDGFTYKQVKKARSDAYLDSYEAAMGERLDRGKRKPQKGVKNCQLGTNCGGTCIEANDTCRLKVGSIASPAEINDISKLAAMISPNVEAAPANAGDKDDLEGLTLRQLKKIGSEKQIYRYSHMTTAQLKNAIRTTRADPKQQERIRKTLEKSREARKLVDEFTPKALSNAWNTIQQISKTAGISPEAAGMLTAGFLLSAGAAATQRMRDRYKTELATSATMAMSRAETVPTLRTNKPNLMFAVGGFGGIGSNGERMRDLLQAGEDGTAGEKWFSKGNEIIPFNHKEFDIPAPSVSKRNPDGSYNAAYLGYVTKQGFGKFVQNFRRGRNEASVDLAASIYAHGVRNPKAGINVLGHGVGGNVVREATEILNRMRSPDGKTSGPEIIKRMSIANLGTPYFGFTNDGFWGTARNRTITSGQDPFSILPKQAAQWISSVKGGEVDDYLRNGEVRERLRESFGYYSNSIRGAVLGEKRKKEFRGAISEALGDVGLPGAAKLWDKLGKIQDKAQDSPQAAAVLATGTLLATGGVTYAVAKKKYEQNLSQGANQAMVLAAQNPAPNIRKPNALFVVGGSGASADDMAKALQDPTGQDQYKKWLEKTHAVQTVDPANLPIMPSGSLQSRNPGRIAQAYATALLRPLSAGKNDDAVRLAAQIYATGIREHSPGGKAGPRKIGMSIVAGSNGGQVVREALDIVRKMDNGSGAYVANRTRFVTLGTPAFGFTGDKVRELNLMGDGDPFGSLPFQRGEGMSQRTNGVSGHDPLQYLGSADAIAKMAAGFGYQNVPATKKKAPPKKPPTPPAPPAGKTVTAPTAAPTVTPTVKPVSPPPQPPIARTITPPPAPTPPPPPRRSRKKGNTSNTNP